MDPEAILQAVRTAQGKTTASQTSGTTCADNLALCGLDVVDCPHCGNTGWIIETGEEPLEIHVRECGCMAQRRSIRSVRNSGMADMLERYTLDSYVTDTEHRRKVREAADRFLQSDTGWFYIAGLSGSGKSHICSGICAEMIRQGYEVRFMPWRDEAVALKALVTDRGEYEARIRRLKEAPVLYIDDFLKGKVTDADINLAFEILNARYNNRTLRTVISSEMELQKVLSLDEAVGGRIYERARGYTVKAPAENWRLR